MKLGKQDRISLSGLFQDYKNMKGGVLSNNKELIKMKRPKQRKFVNKMLGRNCTDFNGKKKGTKFTNHIIRQKLKRQLK